MRNTIHPGRNIKVRIEKQKEKLNFLVQMGEVLHQQSLEDKNSQKTSTQEVDQPLIDKSFYTRKK